MMRLERIEAGEQGWQGTAWALERLHPSRFARPEAQFAQQINVNTGRPETMRFYKVTANTGTHVASLWSSTGTRLATANFANEQRQGGSK